VEVRWYPSPGAGPPGPKANPPLVSVQRHQGVRSHGSQDPDEGELPGAFPLPAQAGLKDPVSAEDPEFESPILRDHDAAIRKENSVGDPKELIEGVAIQRPDAELGILPQDPTSSSVGRKSGTLDDGHSGRVPGLGLDSRRRASPARAQQETKEEKGSNQSVRFAIDSFLETHFFFLYRKCATWLMNLALDVKMKFRVAPNGGWGSSFTPRALHTHFFPSLVNRMSFRSHTSRISGVFLGLLLLTSAPLRSQEPDPVVHAVLFFSPTCPHCHEVINTFLIPLQNEFGSRLVILGMNTSQSWANAIFGEALRHYEIPQENWVVPFLIVDETVLIGGSEIPDQFRAILETGLEEGGIDLPSFPALLTFLEEEGMLDDRYPDRRIARQDPQETPAEAPGAQEDPPQEDPPQEEVVQEEVPAPVVDSLPEGAAAGSDPEAVPAEEEAQDEAVVAPDTTTPPEPVAESPTADPPEATADSPTAEPPETEADSAPPPTTPHASPDASPDVPADVPAEATPTGALDLATAAREMESMTMWDRFNQDPAGNALSVVALLVMMVSLALRGVPSKVKGGIWPDWIIPALVVVGVGVAGYLSYIEITQVEAVCGPVGDCNTVNQSSYATLFGFLPVGILGLMGYGVVLLFWGVGRLGPEALRDRAHLGLWAAVLFGTLFSVYLTFLEPFVIGATCAWCLTSALNMTLLLWATYPLAAQAWPGNSG
jgi:uncharacterized membrane protein/thiol-disulfide isomerase/thioredoxin